MQLFACAGLLIAYMTNFFIIIPCIPVLQTEAIPRFAGQESRMEVSNIVGHTKVSRCSINYARLVSGILKQFQDTAIFTDAHYMSGAE